MMQTTEIANISPKSIEAIKDLENKIAAQDEKVILIAYRDNT
jgi:hypothetical protein